MKRNKMKQNTCKRTKPGTEPGRNTCTPNKPEEVEMQTEISSPSRRTTRIRKPKQFTDYFHIDMVNADGEVTLNDEETDTYHERQKGCNQSDSSKKREMLVQSLGKEVEQLEPKVRTPQLNHKARTSQLVLHKLRTPQLVLHRVKIPQLKHKVGAPEIEHKVRTPQGGNKQSNKKVVCDENLNCSVEEKHKLTSSTITHRKIYTNDLSLPLSYACQTGTCSETCQTLKELTRHKKLAHDELFRIICSECDKEYSTFYVYKSHIRAEHSDIKALNFKLKDVDMIFEHDDVSKVGEVAICVRCGYRYHKEYGDLEHNCDPDELLFFCPGCEFVSLYDHDMQLHLSDKHKEEFHEARDRRFKLSQSNNQLPKNASQTSCGICDFVAETIVELKQHLEIYHSQRPFVCGVCRLGYGKKGDLNRHTAYHRETDMRCSVCEKEFYQQSKLDAHMLMHTSEKLHQCKICNKRFQEEKHVKRHILSNHREYAETLYPTESKKIGLNGGQVDFMGVCYVCGKSCPNSVLKQHIKRYHTKTDVLQCPDCDLAFSEVSALKRHKLVHQTVDAGQFQGNSDKDMLCFIKEKTVFEKGHPSNLLYKCGICEKRFDKVHYVQQHIRVVHLREEDKAYFCQICQKGFKDRRAFNIHNRLHSKAKPYKCRICDKQFRQLGHVKDHLLHHGEPQVKCALCGKMLKSKGNLRAHVNSHCKIQPYKCPNSGCLATFQTLYPFLKHVANCLKLVDSSVLLECKFCQGEYDKSAIISHYHIHENDDKFSCEVCKMTFDAYHRLYFHKELKDHFISTDYEMDIITNTVSKLSLPESMCGLSKEDLMSQYDYIEPDEEEDCDGASGDGTYTTTITKDEHGQTYTTIIRGEHGQSYRNNKDVNSSGEDILAAEQLTFMASGTLCQEVIIHTTEDSDSDETVTEIHVQEIDIKQNADRQSVGELKGAHVVEHLTLGQDTEHIIVRENTEQVLCGERATLQQSEMVDLNNGLTTEEVVVEQHNELITATPQVDMQNNEQIRITLVNPRDHDQTLVQQMVNAQDHDQVVVQQMVSAQDHGQAVVQKIGIQDKDYFSVSMQENKQAISRDVNMDDDIEVKVEQMDFDDDEHFTVKQMDVKRKETVYVRRQKGMQDCSSSKHTDIVKDSDEGEIVFIDPMLLQISETSGEIKPEVQTSDQDEANETNLKIISSKLFSKNSQTKECECQCCGQTFDNISSLRRHQNIHRFQDFIVIESGHPSGLNYICGACDKRFKMKCMLHNHVLNVHTKDENKPYFCSICKRGFVTLANIQIHMKVHTKSKPYRCRICSKQFSEISGVKNHLLHHGEARLECTLCGTKLKSNANFREHVNTHCKIPPFKCPGSNCKRSYKTLYKLLAHMSCCRKIEYAESQIECMFCHHTFDKTHIANHYHVHENDTQFSCEVCDETFVRYIDLYYHKENDDHFIDSEYEIPRNLNKVRYLSLPEHMTGMSREELVSQFDYIEDGNSHRHDRNVTENIYKDKNVEEGLNDDTDQSSVQHKNMASDKQQYKHGKGKASHVSVIKFADSPEIHTDKASEIKTHPKSKGYQCPDCGKTFKKNEVVELKKHKQTHLTMDGFEQMDQKVFPRVEMQMENKGKKPVIYKEFGKSEVLYLCGLCAQQFNDINKAKQHVLIHMEMNDLEKMTADSTELGSTEKKGDPNITSTQQSGQASVTNIDVSIQRPKRKKKKYYPSQPRAKKPKQSQNFSLKLEELRRQKGVVFECTSEQCEEQFIYISKLAIHKRNCHQEIRSYVCDFCKSVFPSYKLFISHTRTEHSDIVMLPYKLENTNVIIDDTNINIGKALKVCTQCGYNFGELEDSFHECRPVDICYYCPWCDFFSEEENKTEVHLVETHKWILKNSGREFAEKLSNKEIAVTTCGICDLEFETNDEMNEHLYDFHSNSPFVCGFCKSCYNECSVLVTHMASHKCDLKCRLCHEEFQQLTVFEVHMNSHTGVKPQSTVSSDINLHNESSEQQVVTHVEEVNQNQKISTHATKEKPKSPLPKYVEHFNLNQRVSTKAKKKKPKKPLPVCHICGQSVKSLTRHMNSHTNEGLYRCPQCAFICSDLIELKKHRNTHPTSHFSFNETQRKKDIYTAITKFEENHPSGLPYKCSSCDKRFRTRKYFHQHVRIMHTKEEDKPFVCEQCNRGFTMKLGLRNHMRLHANRKPYRCNICKKQFRQLAHVRDHLLHHGKPKVVCVLCKSLFKSRGNLRQHVMMHCRIFPFKCPVTNCTASHGSIVALLKHMKSCMKWVGPSELLLCSLCNTSIPVNQSLSHFHVHENDPLFPCEVCESSFPNYPNLFFHKEKESHFTETEYDIPSTVNDTAGDSEVDDEEVLLNQYDYCPEEDVDNLTCGDKTDDEDRGQNVQPIEKSLVANDNLIAVKRLVANDNQIGLKGLFATDNQIGVQGIIVNNNQIGVKGIVANDNQIGVHGLVANDKQIGVQGLVANDNQIILTAEQVSLLTAGGVFGKIVVQAYDDS